MDFWLAFLPKVMVYSISEYRCRDAKSMVNGKRLFHKLIVSIGGVVLCARELV